MAGAATILAMTAGAATGQRTSVSAASALFGALAIAAAIALNAPLWKLPAAPKDMSLPARALARTTVVTATVYAWAGLAMFAIYHLTPLSWLHSWQYGGAMSLFAIGNAMYARRLLAAPLRQGLAAPAALDRVIALAALQGVAITAALAWMIASGKLQTERDDWAANNVFLAGGAALIAISFIAVRTHAALKADADETAGSQG